MKVYISKAKLMLSLKRNESLIANLTDEERNLLLKAIDTSKLDYTIKRFHSLVQNGSDVGSAGAGNLGTNVISSLISAVSNVPLSNTYPTIQTSNTQLSNLLMMPTSNSSMNAVQTDLQNDLQNEFANRPLTSTNLIDQLQLLLAANSRWINGSSVDHYSSLPMSAMQDESSLLDDDPDTMNPIEDEIV